MLRIAVLASGSGSNAEKLHDFFESSEYARVKMIVTNNAKAGVIDRFAAKKVSVEVFQPKLEAERMLELLVAEADLVVLAGYMQLIPKNWTKAFEGRMINIHPALLPKFGGKGMYGKHVHKAVFEAKESETGITIHLVNEQYDEGAIIAQYAVDLTEEDSPEEIEMKVRELELEYYAPTIERWIEHLTLNQ